MPIILDYDQTEVFGYNAKPIGKDKFVYVVFLGDVHLGHKDCSTNYLRKTIKLIQRLSKKHRVLVVLMGDLIETDKDYASDYMIEDVAIRTTEQFTSLLQVLDPIKNLCICAVWGNHEERLIRNTKTKRILEMAGISNLYETILKRLNPNMYVAEPQRGILLKLKLDKQEYDIRISHGSYGGYARPELQHERERKNYPTASLIAMGHHHQKYWDEKINLVMQDTRRAICLQNWIGTGTFLRYPAYAEKKSYPINVMGCPIVKIYDNVQHMTLVGEPEFQPRFIKHAGLLPLPPRDNFIIPIYIKPTNTKYDRSNYLANRAERRRKAK